MGWYLIQNVDEIFCKNILALDFTAAESHHENIIYVIQYGQLNVCYIKCFKCCWLYLQNCLLHFNSCIRLFFFFFFALMQVETQARLKYALGVKQRKMSQIFYILVHSHCSVIAQDQRASGANLRNWQTLTFPVCLCLSFCRSVCVPVVNSSSAARPLSPNPHAQRVRREENA